ncbi:MAG: hypothetical protein EBT88_02720, partial [Proteobacteria bacterium]|nr:hypothetical protein [Pseudomonadota bacterium]
SGVIGDRLGAHDMKWYMLVPAYAFLIAVPTGAAVYLVDGLWAALIIYTLPAFLVQLYTGPTFAMTQSLAPLAMRAAASALLLFIINIIGLVFGPTTVGILSDLLQSSMQMNDIESLRWAGLGIGALLMVLIGFSGSSDFLTHITVFALACFVGYMVIWNVTPALHTPLMSVTNAISGIIVIGGLISFELNPWLSGIAVFIATINIFGGFFVTRRMLEMFHK